jgi:hypothetical protein
LKVMHCATVLHHAWAHQLKHSTCPCRPVARLAPLCPVAIRHMRSSSSSSWSCHR